MGTAKAAPPNEVTLVYKVIAGEHTFFSRDVPGLVVSSGDLREAFGLAVDGLGRHIGCMWGVRVSYEADMTFDEFLTRVNNPLRSLSKVGIPVTSRIHETHAAA